MRFLSVGTVIKWEWPYLVEWVEYYKLMGVEHFYVVINEEEPERTRRILQPYVDEGIMELIYVLGVQAQLLSFNYIIGLSRGRTQWLALIDLDEFVFPINESSISVILPEYSKYAALAVHWRIFGSSGLLESPRSQTKELLRRAPDDFIPNQHVKLICQPEKIRGIGDTSHICNPIPGNIVVDESHKRVTRSLSSFTAARVVINHYLLRSRQDFLEVKLIRNRMKVVNETFWRNHDRNDVFDDSLPRRFSYDVDYERFTRLHT